MSNRWTYKVVEIAPKFFGGKLVDHAQQELDKLGVQGWELVSATQHSSLEPLRLFLKRAV